MRDAVKLKLLIEDYYQNTFHQTDSGLAYHLLANGVVVREWIPMTERLPEHKQLVFVTDTDGSVFSTLFYSEEYFRRNYTHWMSIPEPPMRKGENDNA